MNRNRRRFFAALILVTVFLLGIFTFTALDSDFGWLEVKTILVADGREDLSGLLYRPRSASAATPSPAIVVAHGIGGSKEMMSGIGLELARRGFVALCLDLLGHGNSGGSVRDGTNEPSFGVGAAVEYLRAQSFVNASAIGLIGHSLGGGAVRATFVADDGIGASVLIAGGLGEMAEGPAYGVLNLTFPKNLLVIVGKYDVLLNVTQLQAEELPLAFGTQEAVISGIVYGSFSSQTARKFVTPATTHLFEPVDASVIAEIVWWMMHVFEPEEVSATRVKAHQIYLEREAALLVSLVGFLGIVLLAFFPVSHAARLEPGRGKVKKKHSVLRDWQIFAIWGVLGLALYLPMFFAGFAIPFPPLIFGASIARWTLSVGIVGILMLVGLLPRFSSVEVNLQAALVETLNWKHLGVALGLFLLMFVVASLLDGALNINLRIIAPLFQALTSTRRILAFLAFTPFFLIYFLVEGLYFHELHDWADQTPGFLSGVLNCGKVILGKVAPFVAVIGLQYVPIVLFNLWLFPSFVGFLVEFLWLITPIFIITTMCSWWFYKNTTSVWFGALFNGLMMAWVASTSFPF